MSKSDVNADALFPSEDELVFEDKKSRSKKRPRDDPCATSHVEAKPTTSSVSGSKKNKTTVRPVTSHKKATVRDLFGTDSDEDDDEVKTDGVNPTKHPAIPSLRNNKMNIMIECEKCRTTLPQSQYPYHVKSNVHKSNCLLKTEFNNIEIIATAFKNRIMTYRLNPPQEDEYFMPETFLQGNIDDVIRLINMSLYKNDCIKVNYELYANFMLPNIEEQKVKSFNTKYEIIYGNSDIKQLYSNAINSMVNKLGEFQHCQSGWTFVSVSHLEININKYNPLRGGSFVELPPSIKNTKSCINIQNRDDHCLLWCIVAALYPSKTNVCRPNSYPHYSTKFNIQGMSFPPSASDIRLFEKNNSSISLNIYGLDNKNHVTGPLYKSESRKVNHVNLLFIERNGEQHYCLIKDLLRLTRNQVSRHRGKMFLCEDCLQFYSSKLKYDAHTCSKILAELPKNNSTICFKNFERQKKVNFVVYADFESMLIDHVDCNNTNTRKTKLHKPSCFAFYVCCSHDSSLNKFVTYRGPECAKIFIQSLIKEVKEIYKVLRVKKTMSPLTMEQMNLYKSAKTCHICNELLFDDKVMDHDHITSQFRGAAHSQCNLLFQVCSFVPVLFHNLSGYDCHLFIKELAKYPGEIKIIPKTKEKYITVTKFLPTNDPKFSMQIKFLDSFQFLDSSLNNLSKTLNDEDFVQLSSYFNDEKQFSLMRQKGIYPYEYFDTWSKYSEETLPPKECFYNTIIGEHISDEDYLLAQNVWSTFDLRCLGEYTDLYVKCDVLLLCDIFENFRNTCLQYYNLDPVYYVTLPALSWDAMLLYTKVHLELISDLEIYEMIERGIRGGLAQCSLRHAKANNKYLPDFDDLKPSSYLIYLDCNNLYGYAMMKKMPISDFRFLTTDEINNFDIFSVEEDDEFGYILEVDLLYNDDLHDTHSDMPFAPEKFKPPGGKTPKLIANLYDKFNYIIHYVHLKECLNHGLICHKIHRIIRFRQDDYLRKYIDLNTSLRQQSKSAFGKNLFKKKNNAIFGKTIQNKRKQVIVKLVTRWVDKDNITNKSIGAETLITKPNLKNISIFSENLAAIQLNPEKIILDRPIYIGFSVLEYAKSHLYRFHYNFINKMYNERAKLCYTDTDSLLYFVLTNDFYKDISQHLSEFDTSNFSPNNPFSLPLVNAKVPGIFKDEMGGEVISEFVGLRAKLYCIKSVMVQISKAKGISKAVTNRLNLNNYKNTLFTNKQLKCKMNMIKSIKHTLYSQEVNKLVLNRNDDKRQVLSNQIDTMPWGHWKTIS